MKSLFSKCLSILGLFFLIGCAPSPPPAAEPDVRPTATATTQEATPVIEPTSFPTEPPTQAPIATATLIIPTLPPTLAPTVDSSSSSDSVVGNLLGNQTPSSPTLQNADEAPTRVPTSTPVYVPQFSDRVTTELKGSEFGPAVAADPELDFFKIGFHIGPSGDNEGLSEWMETLDAAGVPFTLKSVGNAGPLADAQEMMRESGVPHVLIYRRSNDEYELPDYDLNPVQAAREHWERHKEIFPPELDPSIVWYETINEPDKMRSSWLGAFALETARLSIQDGYKWAAFGWSSGEPELEDWASPDMVAFLQFAAEHPDQIAISLHEYSFVSSSILRQYPFLVGRFQQLYWVCDQLGIDRPTVLITEFGWEYAEVPAPPQAVPHLYEAGKIYATYPEVKGAAIWYLGPNFGTIDQQTNRLIEPVTDIAVSTYYQRPVNKRIPPEIFK